MDLAFKTKSWWRGEWELYHREQVLVSLAIKNWSYSSATAIIMGKTWEIGYSGWTGKRLFVKDSGGAQVAEAVSKKWFSYDADIVLNGTKYTLKSNGWMSRFYATDEHGAEVVSLKPQWWKGGADVSTTHRPDDPTVLLLASILFYQYKVAETRSAAVS